MPSTAAVDAPAAAPATTQDVGLTPLSTVPVSEDTQLPPGLAQVYGGQPVGTLSIPVPGFLQPSGTSTVTTPVTGPLTFTTFQVNNGLLNQEVGAIGAPTTGAPSSSSPAQMNSSASTSTQNVVNVVVPPRTLDLLGVKIHLGSMDLTFGFTGGANSSGIEGQNSAAVLAFVGDALDLFAAGLSIAAEKLSAAAEKVALPPSAEATVEKFAPGTPALVQVAQLQVQQVAVDAQSLSVNVASGSSVNVSAQTGAGELLGNLLADWVRVEGSGLAAYDAISAKVLAAIKGRTPQEYLEDPFFLLPLLSSLLNPPLLPDIDVQVPDAFIWGGFGSLLSDGALVIGNGSQGASNVTLYPYFRPSFGGYGGGMAGLSSSGPAGGKRVSLKADPDAEVEEAGTEEEQANREDPLPQVLPSVGLQEDDEPPIEPSEDEVASNSRSDGPTTENSASEGLSRELTSLTAQQLVAQIDRMLPDLDSATDSDDSADASWADVLQDLAAASGDLPADAPVWGGITWPLLYAVLELMAPAIPPPFGRRDRREGRVNGGRAGSCGIGPFSTTPDR